MLSPSPPAKSLEGHGHGPPQPLPGLGPPAARARAGSEAARQSEDASPGPGRALRTFEQLLISSRLTYLSQVENVHPLCPPSVTTTVLPGQSGSLPGPHGRVRAAPPGPCSQHGVCHLAHGTPWVTTSPLAPSRPGALQAAPKLGHSRGSATGKDLPVPTFVCPMSQGDTF